MAYPEPLEFNESELFPTGYSECSLSPAEQCTGVLLVNGEPIHVTPATRDSLIDWLVAQRETERPAPRIEQPWERESKPVSTDHTLLTTAQEILHKILLVADAAVGEHQTKETLLRNMATVQELAAGCIASLMSQAGKTCVYDRPAIWDEDRAQLFVESERASDQRPSEAPETLPSGRTP